MSLLSNLQFGILQIQVQDVSDCLTKGTTNQGSVGFGQEALQSLLGSQAPDKFVAAAARSPVCNLSSMVGITDVPDWCYVESYGTNGKTIFTEAPTGYG
ncbi:hypothetical protein V6N11_036322 [Hibiscus sabdariffa]|uniref:Uncharacterized protein n=1 Tax=Hibiscus sabdariffa TaxID=183260 RepID=A0ABR2RA32_9ROSI